MLLRTPDESVIDSNGRVIYFGLKRFIEDIAQGNHCFICGADPKAVPFNGEHVLPDWILRRYGFHNRVITLPNGAPFQYGKFKIPCCTTCNSNMGHRFEKPIREMFDKGYQWFAEQFEMNGPWDLFCWMNLIFLKTHLKDKNISLHGDTRKGETKIGELHSWEDLHHIHCMARSFYTGCDLKPEALGSMLVLPAKSLPYGDKFDYCDLTFAQTMLVRIDDVAVIAVLNDARGAMAANLDLLKKISGSLSPLQLREVMVRMAAMNIRLSERPDFHSDINLLTEEYAIGAQSPELVRVEDMQAEVFGKVMHHVCGPLVKGHPDEAKILENLKTGNLTFLLDDQGNFAADNMDVVLES
jgi:hypothetical protein